MKKISVAVDASRVRSGGGVAHLLGILDIELTEDHPIKEIHVWAHGKLLDLIPNRAWLIKHHPAEAEQSLPRQLYWQATKLAGEIKQARCDILFSVDASTLCRFKPMVVLSQNMLPYEDGIMPLYGLSKDRLRQAMILQVQKRAFHASDATIFLTNHASSCIQKFCGQLPYSTTIAHGVGETFKQTALKNSWPSDKDRPIECVYISPILEYKFQWVVVRAIKMLRDQGYSLNLSLVGGGGKRALKWLTEELARSDPDRQFVRIDEFIAHENIATRIAEADLFIFASGCETFGISLLEAMAVGIPIACSDRSSLPETLRQGGVYFDPTQAASIAKAVESLILSSSKRDEIVKYAKELSTHYSWSLCAAQTWQYVIETFQRVSKAK